MPKRIIDGEAMWASTKLGLCSLESKSLYPWLLPLADARGSFEITSLTVIVGRVAALRPDVNEEVLARVFKEYEDVGLLLMWEVGGKRYAHWVGIEKLGRLPPKSHRSKKYEKILAPPRPKLRRAWRGPTWNPLFEELKRLCEHKCCRCGAKEGDQITGAPKRLDPLRGYYFNRSIKFVLVVDHIVPLSAGGEDSITNIQPLCFGCNAGKSDMPEDFRPQQAKEWASTKGLEIQSLREKKFPRKDWGEHHNILGNAPQNGEQARARARARARETTTAQASPSLEGFETFWQAYPRKVGKVAAFKSWKRLKPPVEEVLSGIQRWSATEQWRKEGGQFIPYPATFLNQRRWQDDPPVSDAQKEAAVGSHQPAYREYEPCPCHMPSFRGKRPCSMCEAANCNFCLGPNALTPTPAG